MVGEKRHGDSPTTTVVPELVERAAPLPTRAVPVMPEIEALHPETDENPCVPFCTSLKSFSTHRSRPSARTRRNLARHPSVDCLEQRELLSTVDVSGQANIYGAGLTVPPDPGGGGGGVLPVKVDLSALGNPQALDFPAVSGSVIAVVGGSNPYNGPDGGPFWGGVTNVPAYGGISGVADDTSTMFLVGVFLGSSGQPAAPPPTLNVTNANSNTSFSPLIGQQFFIGDGQPASNALQTFNVPRGATTLYLGFADSFGFVTLPGYYGDDGGSLSVDVEAAPATEMPDVVISSASFPDSTSLVNFALQTHGSPAAFTVGLYRSAAPEFDSSSIEIGSQVISPNSTNSQNGSFSFPDPLASDPARPYFLVVANPQSDNDSVAAFLAPYNTAFLTDQQLRDRTQTRAEIQALLAQYQSYFDKIVRDADGSKLNLASVIIQASRKYSINPEVLLATLQEESSGVTRTTRPNLKALMGNGGETGRAQINLAAKRLDRYQKLLEAGKTIPSGWKRLTAITTADGITVIPATNAIAGLFAYTPFAGAKWGGRSSPEVPTPGGVYVFYEAWRQFGF